MPFVCFASLTPCRRLRSIRQTIIVLAFATLLPWSAWAASATVTTLALTFSGSAASTVNSGSAITLTASVAVGAMPVTSGQVNFCDASAAFCTDIHLLGSAQITTAGTAVIRLTPGLGVHAYKAVFLGNTADAASTSASQSVQVMGPAVATTTSLSANTASSPPVLTATVQSQGTPPTSPGGSVSFVDTTNVNAVLGSAPLIPAISNFAAVPAPTPSLHGDTVATGDFNNDGKPDLVDFDFSGNLIVGLGNGDGTFHALPTQHVTSYTYTNGVAIGDFNADGKQDLAIIGSGETVTILLGNGDGTFISASTAATGQFPAGIVTGDWNGDGIADLAITNARSSTVTILLGVGDGTFSPAATPALDGEPDTIAVGDFNGDGKQDLAIVIFPANSLTLTYPVILLLGNGDGTFTVGPESGATLFDLESFAVADFNGDGKLDVITASGFGSASVFLGNGDGTFQAHGTVMANSSIVGSFAIGDFNSDGIADVAASDGNGNGTTGPSVLLGNGDGTFTVFGPLAGTYSYSPIITADLNGDGTDDIISVSGYRSPGDAPLAVLLSQVSSATATLTGVTPIGTGTHQIVAVYSGDATFAGSSSNTIGVTAHQVTPALTLSATPASGILGQQVAITATLSPFAEPGLSSDGELITFSSNGTVLGTAPLSSGLATLTVTSLAKGTDNLTASYAGDADFTATASAAVPFTVVLPSPAVTWPAPAPILYGTALSSTQLNATASVPGTFQYSPVAGTVLDAGMQTLSLTFTPIDTGNFATTTATVQLVVNQATLTLSAANTTRVFGIANPAFAGAIVGAVNGDTFTEAYSTTATIASVVGSYLIAASATGPGLANYTVLANPGTLTISKADTTITFALTNQNLTLTATVASTTSGSPSGTVNFFSGQTLLGTGTVAGGVATYTLSALPAGSDGITASYTGDADFVSSSASVPALLVIAPASTSLTVAPGSSVTDVLNFSVAAAYSGTLQLSCTGLPVGSTCSFQPASLVVTAANPHASTTLTIMTGASASLNSLPLPSSPRVLPLFALLWMPSLFAGTLALRRRSRLRTLLLAAAFPGGARSTHGLQQLAVCLNPHTPGPQHIHHSGSGNRDGRTNPDEKPHPDRAIGRHPGRPAVPDHPEKL